jgi:hypothetical protein
MKVKAVKFSLIKSFNMKTQFLIFFVTLIVSTTCEDNKESIKTLSTAINQILHVYFAKKSPKIDFYLFELSVESEKIFKSLVFNGNGSLAYRVYLTDPTDTSEIQLNSSSLLFFNSREDFRKNFGRIIWKNKNHDVRHKHLVYYPKAITSDFQFITDGFPIDQVIFVTTDEGKSIELVTTFMFSPFKCRINKIYVINKFNASIMRWNDSEDDDFFLNKYRHLHGCSLNSVFEILKTYEAHKIFLEFAKLTNAKVRFYTSQYLSQSRNHYDLNANTGALSTSVVKQSVVTFPYFFDRLTFFIPRGEQYSQIEKILQPFGTELWIAVALTLVLGFIFACILELLSLKVSKFVFGFGSPTMNILATFLTGVQAQIPRRNFARFCLMLFIIWSLIIRTCYQSELYKYLQSDNRKPEVKTIAELIARNFTFYHSNLVYTAVNDIADENGLKR